MQGVARWRNLLNWKNSITYSTSQCVYFHSTPIFNEKWKKKGNSDYKRDEQPYKISIKYVTRQRRADTKKALRNFVLKNGATGSSFQGQSQRWNKAAGPKLVEELGDHPKRSFKSGRSKTRGSKKNHDSRTKPSKRKHTRDHFRLDEPPENIFQATFGDRWYTWSFDSWHKHGFTSDSSNAGFDWQEDSSHKYNNNRYRKWEETTSESHSDGNESCNVGLFSDRITLGLPPRGPLKLVDVKKAFHLSALKWHPDKHQGPTQAAAEEKFKQCASAYKSVCRSISTA